MLAKAAFSSPESIPMVWRPMALAYCMANEPRPPPEPTMATVWPGLAPDSFNPLYTVIPAQRIGDTSSRGTPSGMCATCLAEARAYCWKDLYQMVSTTWEGLVVSKHTRQRCNLKAWGSSKVAHLPVGRMCRTSRSRSTT